MQATSSEPTPPPVPLFELQVSLSEDSESLLLSPGEADFVNGAEVILEGFVETCHVVERMLENEDLVCGVVEEEGLEVQTAMKDLILDEEYDEQKSVAMQLLSAAYQNVVVFVGSYHPFRYASCQPESAWGTIILAFKMWCTHQVRCTSIRADV